MPDSTHNGDIQKVAELISDIKFAMLTTADEDGTLRSRPMATQDIEFDGNIWFFTRADAAKVAEFERHRQVNVSFANPEKASFVSTSGVACLVRDRAKLEEFWKAPYKVFFPKGLDDPELALIKVEVHHAEYWDSASTKLGRVFDFARAYVAKDASKLGEHAKVTLA